jgi:hypothetical protein
MPCSYCHLPSHNISACKKASFERAVSIYNDGADLVLTHRPAVLQQWITDSDGHMPSEAVWDLSLQHRFRQTPAHQNVIRSLRGFRGLRPDAPLILEHVNLNHIIVKFTEAARVEMLTWNPNVVIMKVTLVDNKVVVEQLDGEIGRAAHLQYKSDQKLLMLARRRTQQEQTRMARLQQAGGAGTARHYPGLIGTPLPVPVRPPPIPVEELILHTNAIETTECPVCMDPLGNTNKSILRCGHQFCGDCIFRHFQGTGGTKCPCCRSDYVNRVPGWLPPGTRRPEWRHPRDQIIQRRDHNATGRIDTGRIDRLETMIHGVETMIQRVLQNIAPQAQTNV